MKSVLLLVLVGCATSTAPDPGVENLALSSVAPQTIIPGTKLQLAGDSFVDTQWGTATLHLAGDVDLRWPATFVDFSTMTVAVDKGMIADAGGDTTFHGDATIEIVAASDGQTYTSSAIAVDLVFATKLVPKPATIQSGGVAFVNDPIEVDGDGFLLGGDEGTTIAHVTGCFQPDGTSTCNPVAPEDIPLVPADPLSRTKGTFALSPAIAGIKPGSFQGQVVIANQQMGQAEADANPMDASYTLVTSQIFSVDPQSASLGQYVFVHGGGFVGGTDGNNALTVVELQGTFTKTDST
jgi:hypothetical protein